jgi:uncharacterized protein YeaC (DUF1315 family)
MDFEKLISSMSPEINASLKRAIEIGKWPDGKKLTDEQKALCMEAVLTYEQRFVKEEERVGYIDRGSKADGEMCGDTDATSNANDSQEKPLKWTH